MGRKRFFTDVNNIKGNQILLAGMEHNHLKNVMRMGVGDDVIVVCGDEFDYLCEVKGIAKNNTVLSIMQKVKNDCNPNINLTVFQSLIKRPALELIIQKLTELGVSYLVPFESRYSVVKAKEGQTTKLQEISNQSIKQCRRSIPMKIEQTLSFKKMIQELTEYDVVLFANETLAGTESLKETLKITGKMRKIAVIIGPEGGFSSDEISLLSKKAINISMGKRILRAETASIALISIIMFILGEI